MALLFTHAFDARIIVPAAILSGVLILRRRAFGYVMAFSLLVLEALLMPLITIATIVQIDLGLDFTPGEVAGPIAGFSTFAVLAVFVLADLLRKLRTEEVVWREDIGRYESMFGNTQRVAEAIAEGLALHGDVELVEVGRAPAQVHAKVDLVVVGGPTHAFGMSRESTRRDAASETSDPVVSRAIGLREWLDRLESSVHSAPRRSGRRSRKLDGSAPPAGPPRNG